MDHDFKVVLDGLISGEGVDADDLYFDADEVLTAMRHEKLISPRGKVTADGRSWRPDNILTRYAALEAEVVALREAKGQARVVNHGVVITEWVRRKSYTPAQAQAEKDRIDAGVEAGKIEYKRAAKHKAWVTRRTTK